MPLKQSSSPPSLNHEAVLDELKAARGTATTKLVARYDAHLQKSPNDHLIAIERCRFLQAIAYSEEDEDDEQEYLPPDAMTCAEALDARFGRQPEVVLFRLSTLWGEESLVYGRAKLGDSGIPWSPSLRSEVLGLLANRERSQGHLREAADFAQQAEQWNGPFDPSLFTAEYLHSEGRTAKAIEALKDRITSDGDSSRLVQKARLLLELDAAPLAMKAIHKASELGLAVPLDPVLHGRVLESVGDTEAARQVYAKQSQAWNRKEILTRLFYIDLQRGDAATARRSYVALRDLGWKADSLGRHRIALALKHPGAPWAWRDAVGLLALLALLVAFILLPLLIILPVHYIGLIRGARGAIPELSDWSLFQAWIALCIFYLAGVVGLYFSAYSEIATWFDERAKSNLTQGELARAGLLTFTLIALSSAALARRKDWQALARPRFVNTATFIRAFKYLLLMLLVGGINNAFARWWNGPTQAPLGIALSTTAMIAAMKSQYGIAVAIFFTAIVAPICEEFLMRGVLLSGLRRHVPFLWANIAQASLFALLHDDVVRFPFLFTMGFLTGHLQRRTGGLATGMMVHAANNAIAVLLINR